MFTEPVGRPEAQPVADPPPRLDDLRRIEGQRLVAGGEEPGGAVGGEPRPGRVTGGERGAPVLPRPRARGHVEVRERGGGAQHGLAQLALGLVQGRWRERPGGGVHPPLHPRTDPVRHERDPAARGGATPRAGWA